MKNTKSITINGKTYVAKEFSYNTLCDLQEMGCDITQAKSAPMALVRAYVSICMGVDKDTAGAEIEEHMINGGDLGTVTEVLLNKIENSDFFRRLSENQEKETEKSTK